MATRYYFCPNCEAEARTGSGKKPFHMCPKIPGLSSPLIERGVKAKIEAVERGDYVGSELVQYDDNGRPIMSVVVTRDEGQDVAVYPATATGGIE